MGTLTKDMTRLCEEIQILRARRQELKRELVEEPKHVNGGPRNLRGVYGRASLEG